jgi:hypothetical protein
MMPALPVLPLQRDPSQLIIINIIVSIMPARHRDRDSGHAANCPRSGHRPVHVVLE